ncbi:MAG: ABC transporter ATP-binding protein [Spirochaetaceae bacterium]
MNALVQVRNLHKSFGSFEVLKGVDLDFVEGEVTSVVGQSGTGKSLLFKCILGLIPPDDGSITLGRKTLEGLDPDEMLDLRKDFGYAFQNDALFDSMTIWQNIAFPLREVLRMKDLREIDRRVQEMLEWIELPGVDSQLPAQLSGGQRKRIGIARALAIKPKILLFDEPTSGLDPILAWTINNVVRRVNKELGLTCILITHDIPAAFRISDKIAFLHEGHVVAVGSAPEVSSSNHEIVREFIDNSLFEGGPE